MWLHKIMWSICTGFSEYLTFYKGGKGGGGGGGGQTSTSYSTNLPEYAKPFYEELLKQSGKQIYQTDAAGNVTGVKEFTPYTGERIAGFTPEQQRVQQDVQSLTTPGGFQQGQQALGSAQQLGFGAAGAGLGQAFGYQAGPISARNVRTQSFNQPGIAQSYMSPYQQAVTDVEKREALRQANIQKQGGAMGSITRGTFGGARQALAQSEADRNTQQLLADIQARGGQQSYQQAQQAFQADQAARLQAQQANQQAGLQAQQLMQQGQQFQAGLGKDIGLAGLGAGIETAAKQSATAAAEQTANLERLKAQAASAGEQQALQQEINNIKYQQFMEQQDFQRKLLEYQSNILRGNAAALGTTQVQYAPAPSLASQLGGVGLAGLGLYNLFGKG